MAGESKSIVAAVAEVNDLKDAISDLKKEIDEALGSLNNFGRVGSLSVRNLGSEARSLQSAFRDISREWRRLSTPAGTIGAAATSQALGALTGRGGGGGGGGGGGAPRMGGLGGLAGGVGAIVGGAGTLASQALGSLVSKLPFGDALSGLITGAGKVLSKGAAVATTAGMSGGIGLIEDAMGRRMSLEQAGRGYGGWERMLPKQTMWGDKGHFSALRKAIKGGKFPVGGGGAGAFGFNAEDYIRTTLPMIGMAGPGKEGRKALESFVGNKLLPYSTSGGLGVGAGELQGFTGAARDAGLSFKDIGGLFGKTMAVGGMGNTRQNTALLSAMKSSLAMLVNLTGQGNQEAAQSAAMLVNGIQKTTGFSAPVAAATAVQLQAAATSPGGGAGGEIAMLQTYGYGNPNLNYQANLAKQMGIKDWKYWGRARPNYLRAKIAWQGEEDSQRKVQALLIASRRQSGPNIQHWGQTLSTMSGGSIPLAKAVKLVEAASQGRLGELIGGEMPAGKAARPGNVSTTVLDEFNKMQNLILSLRKKEMALIARSITKIKIGLLEPVTKLLLRVPSHIEKAVEKINKIMQGLDLADTSTMKTDFETMRDVTGTMLANFNSMMGGGGQGEKRPITKPNNEPDKPVVKEKT